MKNTKEWFELADIRRRRIAESVWISLRATEGWSTGKLGTPGYQHEFFGASSVAFPVSQRELASGLDWMRMGLLHRHGSYAFASGAYKAVDVFQEPEGTDVGIELVLDQEFDGAEEHVWHLNQDVVFALGLMRENDTWVRPHEGYIEVAHLKRDASGAPVLFEIRAEHLRDYLAARGFILRIVTYRERDSVTEQAPSFGWPGGGVRERKDDERFEARFYAIHEGGNTPFGEQMAVFHIGRNDVDTGADVPVFGDPSDDNTSSRSWSKGFSGRKVFRVSGELWRNEWIEPGPASPRVRGDKMPSTLSYVVDAAGTREQAGALTSEDVGRWLWFKAEVVPAVATRRGGALKWYTRDTGQVAALYGYGIHFGINSKDLVTAYAADIARLPAWQQQVWAGFNVAPDGKVSEELLAAQMKAEPAETAAPEELLVVALNELDDACNRLWGELLFRAHPEQEAILQRCHRFRSLAQDGFLELAKDLARVIVDRMNSAPLNRIVPLAKDEKRGSLKSLERAVATLVGADDARRLMGPLFGLYELRLADAHLPSKEMKESFDLLGIDSSGTWLRQGMRLLEVVSLSLHQIANGIDRKVTRSS